MCLNHWWGMGGGLKRDNTPMMVRECYDGREDRSWEKGSPENGPKVKSQVVYPYELRLKVVRRIWKKASVGMCSTMNLGWVRAWSRSGLRCTGSKAKTAFGPRSLGVHGLERSCCPNWHLPDVICGPALAMAGPRRDIYSQKQRHRRWNRRQRHQVFSGLVAARWPY